ncbi:MAG: alpha/beta fold hydrolase [Streptococcaceae bacterium]|jgi:2-succinyl-6-hydroxy-2,4-cyclohexadiene-1-carboxylate synthase|nr:alpha/beta fold hydrolase [Streptococcaceae bacterium]
MTKKLYCLHGFAQDSSSWDGLEIPSWEIVSFDLLPHLQTSIEDFLAWLHENIPEPRPALLGYSMGGRLAMAYADRFPVGTLIIESAALPMPDGAEKKKRYQRDLALAAQIEGEGQPWFADYWTQLPIFESERHLSSEKQAQLYQTRLNQDPKILAKALRVSSQGIVAELTQPLSEKTFYISGGLDAKYSLEAQKFSHHYAIENAGHNTHFEQTHTFNNLLKEILS